jgi:hypothetical protein
VAERGTDSGPEAFAARKVLATGAAVVVVLVVVLAGAYGLYVKFAASAGAPAPGAKRDRRAFNYQPHLQAHPQQDLQALRRHKQAILESYGWVDRDAGIARIPVSRAMSLLARRQGRESEDKSP